MQSSVIQSVAADDERGQGFRHNEVVINRGKASRRGRGDDGALDDGEPPGGSENFRGHVEVSSQNPLTPELPNGYRDLLQNEKVFLR